MTRRKRSVEITKRFFEKFKEKISNSSQFTVEYKYDTRFPELLMLFVETEDFRVYIGKNGFSEIHIVKYEKQNGKGNGKYAIDGEVKNAEFTYDSLSTVKEAIEELKSQYQCINEEVSPESYLSDDIMYACYTFSNKK